MIATEDARSPNFGFLAKRYPELEQIAARSERYFSDDPIVWGNIERLSRGLDQERSAALREQLRAYLENRIGQSEWLAAVHAVRNAKTPAAPPPGRSSLRALI